MHERNASLAIVGIGNEFRSDDAAGLLVARRLRAVLPEAITIHECGGDVNDLLELFNKHSALYLIDAIQIETGRQNTSEDILRIDALKSSLRDLHFRASTHILGVAEAIELARVLGSLPDRLVVIAIPVSNFQFSNKLSSKAQAGVEHAVKLVHEELTQRQENRNYA